GAREIVLARSLDVVPLHAQERHGEKVEADDAIPPQPILVRAESVEVGEDLVQVRIFPRSLLEFIPRQNVAVRTKGVADRSESVREEMVPPGPRVVLDAFDQFE